MVCIFSFRSLSPYEEFEESDYMQSDDVSGNGEALNPILCERFNEV